MADLSVKIIADKLGKSLENLADGIEGKLNDAVKNLANTAYASMISQVQSSAMSPKNRQDYLSGLKFMDLGDNNYMIYLDGDWANQLEDGFGSYNMRDTLLNSNATVSTGSRKGMPWVQKGKKGKYAHVPFEHKPMQAQSGDLASEIKKMTATNRQGVQQEIMKVFKDDFGKPIAGKVATLAKGAAPHPNLEGLTKYQKIDAAGRVRSFYMTFRTISEATSGGWQHPGYSGKHFFDEAERDIELELENIIKTLL